MFLYNLREANYTYIISFSKILKAINTKINEHNYLISAATTLYKVTGEIMDGRSPNGWHLATESDKLISTYDNSF